MAEFEVYVEGGAMNDAERHVMHMASQGKEGLGLLLGNRFNWNGQPYVYVDQFVTAQNHATAVSVQFSRNAFVHLAQELQKHLHNRIVVGWLHSHPGYGCFLSGTDIRTQSTYFTEPYHVAFVIDPKRSESHHMLKRAFRVKNGQFFEVPFAIVEKIQLVNR